MHVYIIYYSVIIYILLCYHFLARAVINPRKKITFFWMNTCRYLFLCIFVEKSLLILSAGGVSLLWCLLSRKKASWHWLSFRLIFRLHYKQTRVRSLCLSAKSMRAFPYRPEQQYYERKNYVNRDFYFLFCRMIYIWWLLSSTCINICDTRQNIKMFRNAMLTCLIQLFTRKSQKNLIKL